MSQDSQIIVNRRENSGTGSSRSLRKEKKVPGIIYGEKKDPIAIALDEKTLKLTLSTLAKNGPGSGFKYEPVYVFKKVGE